MTDERGRFLHAILLDPADDAPREQFADWLMENGEPERGEFVRVQLELARPHECPGAKYSESGCYWCGLAGTPLHPRYVADGYEECAARCRLRGHERVLLERHGARWADPVVSAAPLAQPMRWQWSRGFPTEITLPAADFARHAGALFGSAPLERVVLTDAVHHADDVGYDGSFWIVESGDFAPELWDAITNGRRLRFVMHHDRETVLGIVSRGCVRFGRLKARLPPLPCAAQASPVATPGKRGRGSGRLGGEVAPVERIARFSGAGREGQRRADDGVVVRVGAGR